VVTPAERARQVLAGLTILYEIGDIDRFPTVQDFLSCCRRAKRTLASAGRIKGLRGAKIGNPYSVF
jgi:transposase